MAFCRSSLAWKRFAGISILGYVLWNLELFPQDCPVPNGVQTCNDSLTVLIWDWPFGNALNISGDVCATHYNTKGCHLTDDRSLYNQSDVVMFHHRELQLRQSHFPSTKLVGQNWLWVSLESPSNLRHLARWNGVFNWVMTYRRDSDIFAPYGELLRIPSDSTDIPTKTGLVSWVISNYHRNQRRAQLYRKLARHIKIDVYGTASRKPLCKNCILRTISQYKFYLAFENSIHVDYITEKLWKNALFAGSVPIVLGPPRANYEQFIPAASFIHVDDFDSMEKLAAFLLTMNDSHYQSFFEWKKNYTVKWHGNWLARFCGICSQYPHLPKEKVYADLKSWLWS